MMCGNCPGLDRSYMVCRPRGHQVFLVTSTENCPEGEDLLVHQAEKGETYPTVQKELEREAVRA